MIILETIKVTHFFSDDWIMVINSTAAVQCTQYPTQMVCCENWYTYSMYTIAIVLFLLKKEKKGERWNGSCSGKKPAVTLWIYEICDDQHGFQKPASFKKEGHQTQQASHTSLLSFVEVITPQRSYGTAQEGERGDETFIQGLSNHLVDITSLIFCTKY